MESIQLDMEDILGAEADFDEAQLPDMETELEPMRAEGEDAGQEGEDGAQVPDTDDPDLLAKLKSMKGASKNPTTKRTMPKLDATRLTGERGLAMLPQIFEKVPLKGKNHEVEDLKLIMRHLTHWGHRLFPKMPVDEVFDRCEKLGKKREVQTCVKRIRMDMPLFHGNPGYNMEEDDVQRVGDAEDDVQRFGEAEDDVQRFGDHEEQQIPGSPDAEAFNTEIDEEEIEDLLRDQEEYDRQQEEENSNSKHSKTDIEVEKDQMPKKTADEKGGLSEEVRARIARNKLLAQQRRAQKLGNATDLKNTDKNKNSAVLDDLDKTKGSDTDQNNSEATLYRKVQEDVNVNSSVENSHKLKDYDHEDEINSDRFDSFVSSKVVKDANDIESEKLKHNEHSMDCDGPHEMDL